MLMIFIWPILILARSSCESSDINHRTAPRVVDDQTRCRNCVPVFQQIEFFIRRSSCEETQIVKENFNELSKTVCDILYKSNDKLDTCLIETKAQLVKFSIHNIRNLVKEFVYEVDKHIAQAVSDYNDASSTALSAALSSYTAAANSLNAQPEATIRLQLSTPSSSFNTTVSAIISGVAAANTSSLKVITTNMLSCIQEVINRIKDEIIEILKHEIEDRTSRVICVVKNHNENDKRAVEAAIERTRDELITDLEKHDIKLFEVVRYLLELCREEVTGEKRAECGSSQFSPLLAEYGLNTNEGSFPFMYPGLGIGGVLN